MDDSIGLTVRSTTIQGETKSICSPALEQGVPESAISDLHVCTSILSSPTP